MAANEWGTSTDHRASGNAETLKLTVKPKSRIQSRPYVHNISWPARVQSGRKLDKGHSITFHRIWSHKQMLAPELGSDQVFYLNLKWTIFKLIYNTKLFSINFLYLHLSEKRNSDSYGIYRYRYCKMTRSRHWVKLNSKKAIGQQKFDKLSFNF